MWCRDNVQCGHDLPFSKAWLLEAAGLGLRPREAKPCWREDECALCTWQTVMASQRTISVTQSQRAVTACLKNRSYYLLALHSRAGMAASMCPPPLPTHDNLSTIRERSHLLHHVHASQWRGVLPVCKSNNETNCRHKWPVLNQMQSTKPLNNTTACTLTKRLLIGGSTSKTLAHPWAATETTLCLEISPCWRRPWVGLRWYIKS